MEVLDRFLRPIAINTRVKMRLKHDSGQWPAFCTGVVLQMENFRVHVKVDHKIPFTVDGKPCYHKAGSVIAVDLPGHLDSGSFVCHASDLSCANNSNYYAEVVN